MEKIIDLRTGNVDVLENARVVDIPYFDYEQMVSSKIRERYTSSQEFAILRQKEEKPEEWQEYYDYCEACKQEVRQIIGI